MWRSLLYVPGDNLRAIAKARELPADAILFDLEDAVAPEHKAQARENIAQAMSASWPRPFLVRVNGAGSPWLAQDLELVRRIAPSGVVLPKTESVKAVQDAINVYPDLPVWANVWASIETPLGVLNAPAIAALPGVAGLLVGANDLARALRTQPHPERLPLLHALSAVVLAARAAGKLPIDAVYNDVRDEAGLVRECQQGRMLGFAGKAVIHPGQIAAANAAYGVSGAEADEARTLLAAWAQARADGHSVTTHRGALLEQMHADAAAEALAQWEAQQ